MSTENIAVVGIGRMGKGIALAFAYAGFDVDLIDSEDRFREDFSTIENETRIEIKAELDFLQSIGIISNTQIESINSRIQLLPFADASAALSNADFVFEAVLEIPQVKQSVYKWLGEQTRAEAVVSSTTSTMSANDLAAMLSAPQRFINAHWLNPAHLMPVVEVSPADLTATVVVKKMTSLLERIGKITVVCKASPGFIISRIQALALNEAARIVEEGVATAEDVDKAIKYGFGIRYATLGMLEFIDFGGGDILYHGTRYLGDNLSEQRFNVPEIVQNNMENNRNGLRDGEGFYDWKNIDTNDFNRQKMTDFVRLLQHRQLMPAPESINEK